MGNTCASFHVHWLGAAADAGRAITRAYGKLGWDKAKRPPAEGGKTVIVLARAGEPFVSVYDSTQADLDSGELKDAALTASKMLKTGAVFTTVYDSDTYEFAIFGKGKQIDLLMSDIEFLCGPDEVAGPQNACETVGRAVRAAVDCRRDRAGGRRKIGVRGGGAVAIGGPRRAARGSPADPLPRSGGAAGGRGIGDSLRQEHRGAPGSRTRRDPSSKLL